VTGPTKGSARVYGGLAALLTPVALLRLVPFQTPYPFLAIESLAFWLLLPAYLLALIAFVRGHRRIAGWLGGLALVHLVWSFEWLPEIDDGSDARPLLRVLDANLLAPRPSDALADEVLGADADVLALQEVSFEWLARLDARGARETYPYRIAEPHTLDHDYMGIAILSRRPFADASIDLLPGADFVPIARADLYIDSHAIRIYSVHTGPPAVPSWAEVWEVEMDWLEARLQQDIARGGIVVATGDFNLSPFSFGHRRLRAIGMHEAHETAGRGTTVTWPNGVFGAPPMRLDHAYVHGAAIRSVRELPAHTSDHSPIVVDLALR
jgi:endonuclease/exonuclease/phosphatase (EEP) superfamily protein YafD